MRSGGGGFKLRRRASGIVGLTSGGRIGQRVHPDPRGARERSDYDRGGQGVRQKQPAQQSRQRRQDDGEQDRKDERQTAKLSRAALTCGPLQRTAAVSG